MTLLTLVTRTCRPILLKRCITSVIDQTRADLIQHYIIHDDEGKGVGWANRQLAEHAEHYTGDYVQILDDDDWLAYPQFAAELGKIVIQQDRPDVIVCKMDLCGRTLPTSAVWQRFPVRGHIAFPNVIMRRDVFWGHKGTIPNGPCGDFALFAAIWQEKPRAYWWDKVVQCGDRVSRGKRER